MDRQRKIEVLRARIELLNEAIDAAIQHKSYKLGDREITRQDLLELEEALMRAENELTSLTCCKKRGPFKVSYIHPKSY